MDLKDNQFTNKFMAITKANRAVAIIISIVMLVLGVLGFVYPLGTVALLMYILAIALIVFGAYQIIVYAIGKTGRNAFSLVCGILLIVIGMLLLIPNPLGEMLIFAIFATIFLVIDAINRFCGISAAKAANAPYGLLILCGILDLILAVFLVITPFAMTGIFGILFAIYFIIGGSVLLVDACSRPSAQA